MTRRFARLAWLAATCTYLLIILGAIVRITGSGLGCGEHWPLCNGRLLPPLDLPTVIEYGHRLAPAAGGGLVAGPAPHAWGRGGGGGGGERGAVRSRRGGLRRACVTRRAGPARRPHREAQLAAVDRDPAPRHGDAAARDAARRGKAGQTDPGRQPGEPRAPVHPGLAPGVSGDDRPHARIRHRAARRPHREPRRRQRMPGVSALQRRTDSSGELPAARALDAPTAGLRVVWIL